MAELSQTPQGNRIHIAFFGLRNAGKSTLVNAFCGQDVAIVSPTPGTTTDPVAKAMEILPLGPCLVTDTAGLDDEGELGLMRVEKTLRVLDSTDIAVWVNGDSADAGVNPARPESAPYRQGDALSIASQPALNAESFKTRFLEECRRRQVAVIEFNRGESAAELKAKIAAVKTAADPALLEGLVKRGDRVTLVCPIDESAPKGRLILPQVQVLRECLDRHAIVRVVQPDEFTDDGALTIVDSQTFGRIRAANLTSFSILFARQKGDLDEFKRGLAAARALRDGDRVLIAEACTHHRQCNDIGATKIPKALAKLSGGAKIELAFASGNDFAVDGKFALVVHCGGCMLTRRTMLARIARCRAAAVPVVNYGLLLQAAANTNLSANCNLYHCRT